MYIVYRTTNLINNHFYIGVHKCKSIQFDGYIGNGVYITKPKSYAAANTKFKKAVLEFGVKNFYREIIQVFSTEQEAYKFEAELVNAEFLKRPDVYNQVLGGQITGGINQKPCYQYNKDGVFVTSYKSSVQAAETLGISPSTIRTALRQNVLAADFYWSRDYYESLDMNNYKKPCNTKCVYQYSVSGEYIKTFDSISNVAKLYNTTSSELCKIIRLQKQVLGCIFSYLAPREFKLINVSTSPIYQYSFKGEYIKEYSNVDEVEKLFNLQGKFLKKFERNSVICNFLWSFEKVSKMTPYVNRNKKKVGQYDLNGNLIKIYNSVMECTKDFVGCRHVLVGRHKTSKGFIFKYIS